MKKVFTTSLVSALSLASSLVLSTLDVSASPKPTAPKAAAQADTSQKGGETRTNKRSLDLNEQGIDAMKSQHYSMAAQLFQKAVALDSRNLTAVFNLSGAYLALKKTDSAIKLLSSYEASNDPGIISRLGDAYFGAHDLKKALIAYEKAYKIAPQYLGLASKLGTIYVMEKRMPDAEKMFLEAVNNNPKDGQALSNLASVFLASGKAQDAVGTAKRALQVTPTKELYLTLGLAYESMKDYKNSLISLQRASELGDTTEDLKKKIEEIKSKVS